MTIQSKLTNNNKELNIFIDGRFDFNVLQPFRSTYENIDAKPERFIIDLEKSTYIDSSALGMLLALRDFAGGDDSEIVIKNCSNDIKKIFTITKLDELFNIS